MRSSIKAMDYTPLEWDTAKFGYKIALINNRFDTSTDLKQTLQTLKVNQFVLAYLFVPTENDLLNTAANDLHGRLVDEKITYVKQPGYVEDKNEAFTIRPYDVSIPLKSLITLSIESGIYSRFKIDPNFNNQEYEKLYTEWIINSISKKIAFEVLLCFVKNQVAGLITLGLKNSIGNIGLVAVNKQFRGKGIGLKLMGAAENLFYEKRIKSVQVVTQGINLPACKLYQKCGFTIDNKENVYHFWLQKTP